MQNFWVRKYEPPRFAIFQWLLNFVCDWINQSINQSIRVCVRLKVDGVTGSLTELSNAFYSVIPHDFKRTRPPIIDDLALVQEKFDMLSTLGDIELAQQLQKQDLTAEEDHHPCDVKYSLLKCKLRLLDHSGKEYKVEGFFSFSQSVFINLQIQKHFSKRFPQTYASFRIFSEILCEKNFHLEFWIFWTHFFLEFFERIFWTNFLNEFFERISWTNFLNKFFFWIFWSASWSLYFPSGAGKVLSEHQGPGKSAEIASHLVDGPGGGRQTLSSARQRRAPETFVARHKRGGRRCDPQNRAPYHAPFRRTRRMHEITNDDSSLVAAPPGYDSVLACGQVEPGTSLTLYRDDLLLNTDQQLLHISTFYYMLWRVFWVCSLISYWESNTVCTFDKI